MTTMTTKTTKNSWGFYLAFFVAFVIFVCIVQAVGQGGQGERITIRVDASKRIGPMKPIWAWFGYDEPNYTYMKDGQKLLTELAELSPVPVFVRTHNLLTTGDGTAGAQVGLHQRLHRRRQRQAELRLDDRRSHHRHLPAARHEAARRDRLHAGSALHQAAAVPARLEARRRLQPHLHRLGVSAEGLREVGRARLPVGRSTRVKKYGRAEVESW